MLNSKCRKEIRVMLGKMPLLALSLMLLLSSCARQPSYEIEETHEKSQSYSEWKYDGSSYLSAKEKSELVTAHADAGGEIKEITDSVTLKGIKELSESGAGAVRDTSDLKDIINKNGDEEFELKDGHVFFQNLGSDISYEGKGSKELPVSVDVKYYLDGEEMSPDKIKGRKGHVKIEYKIQNSQQCEVEIGGEIRNAYVPFAAISLVMPEAGTYRNLKLKDCKLSSFNNEDIIMAMTMPGMSENLKYLDMDTSDADIPESFTIELDTDSFEMGFSTTIATSNILDESIDLGELTDMKSSLADLKKAGSELSDGGDKIQSALTEFEGYLSKYTEGVSSVNAGVAALSKGVDELDKSKAEIYNGAKGISDGIAAFDEGFAKMKESVDAMADLYPDNAEIQELRKSYDEMHQAMAEQLALLNENGAKYTEGVSGFNAGIGELKKGADELKKGSAALSSQGENLVNGYAAILSAFKQFNSGLCEFYNEGLVKLYNEGSAKIDDIEGFVRMMEEADDGYKTYSGLEEGQDGRVTFIIETDGI